MLARNGICPPDRWQAFRTRGAQSSARSGPRLVGSASRPGRCPRRRAAGSGDREGWRGSQSRIPCAREGRIPPGCDACRHRQAPRTRPAPARSFRNPAIAARAWSRRLAFARNAEATPLLRTCRSEIHHSAPSSRPSLRARQPLSRDFQRPGCRVAGLSAVGRTWAGVGWKRRLLTRLCV